MADVTEISILTYKKDSYIVVEDKSDSCFYIIQEGKVQISRELEVVKERDGTIMGPGDFFGAVSALSSHSHIETALALTDVTLMVIPESQFDLFIQDNSDMVLNIITQFSMRMRYLNKGLTQLTLNDSNEAEEISHLFDLGKYYDRVGEFSHSYYAYRQYLKYCPEGEHAAEAQERVDAVALYAKEEQPFMLDGKLWVYGANMILYAQGEPGLNMYVIHSGSVRITKIVNDNEILLAVLKPGDFVGEMAILESKPRSVTAITHEECILIAISKESFNQVVTSNPQISGRLLKSLAERIWFLYKQLSNIMLTDPVARMYDALLIQMEKERINLESTAGYAFTFGIKELIAMTGLTDRDAEKATKKILEDRELSIIDDKLYAANVAAITKSCHYFKSLEGRKKAFRKKRI